MKLTREQVLNGYKKSREIIKQTGEKVKIITEPKTIEWKGHKFDLEKGHRVIDVDDTTLARIMYMDIIMLQAYASGIITLDDVHNVTEEDKQCLELQVNL